jgi:single-stranded-DNA-specific exonuclease
VEAEAKLADLDLQLIADLKRLEPHGAGNPAPLFVVKGCRVESAKTMGKTGEHLSLSLSQPGRPAKPTRCVAWSMAERVSDAIGFLDVIGVPQVNEWMGRRSVELEVKAFRQAVPPSAW